MARIINLSEAVLIALHSLVIIARLNPKPVSTKYLASTTGASENTISKVMQRLVKDNLIHSGRGPAGGFSLVQSPGKISFMDIFESVEGKMETGICFFNNGNCTFGKCIFENYLCAITNDVRAFFSGKTLADYV